MDLHRTVERHRAVDPPHDWGTLDQVIAIIHSPEAPSDRQDDSQKNSTIAVRSNRDRGSFVVESPPRSLDGGRWSINTTIDARSWPDRGVIMAQWWRDRGLFEVKLKLFYR